MLAEKYQQLLTAYIDGELSARQRRTAQKLLRRSPEARALLRKLQEDSSGLIDLPLPATVPDLSGSVLQSIAQQAPRPARRPLRPKQGISAWAGVAAAAAVLIAVGATSYLLVAALSEDSRPGHTAHRRKGDNDVKQPEDKTPRPEQGNIVKKPDNPIQPPQKKDSPSESVKGPDKKPDPQKPDPPEKKPDPPEPDVIATSQSIEVFQPGAAEVALPTLLKLRDLGADGTHKRLTQELGHYDAFYLEVLCREATYAFPRLQSVLQAGGVEVIVDHTAQERLKQPQFKTNYCVYLEDVTPEELARLLAPLGQEDPKADKKKPAFGQFAGTDPNLIFIPMGVEHRRRLTALLGVDPRQAKTTGPLGVDLKKPLAEQTAAQVAEALSGTRPAAGKADRSAVVLPYIPNAVRQTSPEVKRYLDGRKPARKGTLQVLLVLRGKP